MAFKAGAIYGEASLDTKKWDSSLKKLAGGVTKTMAAVGAAFVAGMGVAIKQANDFQIAMGNVASITEDAEVNTVEITKALLVMDPALGTTTELTKGLYQAFSAGAEDTEEAMQITVDAAKFAKGALTDTSTAVDVLTTAVNAYGRENMDTTKASDIFFNTIKEGKVTGAELASSLGASIPLFSSVGIELGELTSGIAAMTKQGVNSANATTQLNAIVNAFIKPSEGMKLALEEQGIESGSALLKTEGLSGALEFLEEQTGGNAEKLGELVPNIRGLRGVMTLSGQGAAEFAEILGTMATSAGSADQAFLEQEKTFATLKTSLNNGLVVFGNIGKTLVDDVAQGATAAAEGLIAFMISSQGGELVGRIIGWIAGAFAALKAALQPIVDRIGPAWQGIVETLQDSMGKLGLNTEKSAGGSKILAIVSATLASAITIVSKAIEMNILNLTNFILAMRESGQVIGTFFKALIGRATWAEVKEQAAEAGEAFKTLGVEGVANIRDYIETVTNEFKGFTEQVNDTATNVEVAFETAYTNTRSTIEDNWSEIVTGQYDATSKLTERLRDWRDAQKATLEEEQEDQKEHQEEKNEIVTEGEAEIEAWRTASYQRQKIEDRIVKDESLQREIAFKIKKLDEVKKAYTKEFTIVEEADEEILIEQNGFYDDSILLFDDFTDTIVTREQDLEEARLMIWRREWDAKTELVREKMDLIKGVFNEVWGSIMDIVSNAYGSQTQTAELAFQEQMRLLDDKLENETITEKTYAEEKTEIDEERAKKLNKIAEKEFKAGQANRIAQAIMSGASSIMGWWQQAPLLGPIAGPIFAGIMTGVVGGLTLAQIGQISSEKYVPRFKRGGRTTDGLSMINEGGGEIVRLPDGSIVVPNDISRMIAEDGGTNMELNVSFAGAHIDSNMNLDRITNQVSRKLGRELRLARAAS